MRRGNSKEASMSDSENTRMLPQIAEEPSAANGATNNAQTQKGIHHPKIHEPSRNHPLSQSWSGTSKKCSFKVGDENPRGRSATVVKRNSASRGLTQSLRLDEKSVAKIERRQSFMRMMSGSYMHVPIERRELTSSHRASREASLRSSRRLTRSTSYASSDIQPPQKQQPPELPEPHKGPSIDRGWAWVVMLACCATFFFGDGIAFTFGVLYPELLKEFGEDNRAQVTLVGSVLTGFYLGPGPIASAMGDKLGYRITAIIGSLLASLSFLAASFSPNVETLIVFYGAFGGLGFCFMFVSGMIATTLYFEEKRPIALGVAACGSGLGIIVFPFVLRGILKHLAWRWLVRIEAGILLLGVLFALSYIPFPKTNTPENRDQPKISFCKQITSLIDWKLLKSPLFLLIGFTAMFATLGISTPFFFVTDMAMERGLEADPAAFLISIMGITNTVGRIAVGLVAYKLPLNPLLLLAFGQLVGGVMTCLSFLYTSYATLAVYVCINGFVYAFDAVLSTEILAKCMGRRALAGAFGLLCLCRGITISITGPVGGVLYEKTGSYNATFYLAGACVLCACVLTFITYVVARRRPGSPDDSMDEADNEQYDEFLDSAVMNGQANGHLHSDQMNGQANGHLHSDQMNGQANGHLHSDQMNGQANGH